MFSWLGPVLKTFNKLFDWFVKRSDKKEREEKIEEKQKEEREIREDPADWLNRNFSSEHQRKQKEDQEKTDNDK